MSKTFHFEPDFEKVSYYLHTAETYLRLSLEAVRGIVDQVDHATSEAALLADVLDHDGLTEDAVAPLEGEAGGGASPQSRLQSRYPRPLFPS